MRVDYLRLLAFGRFTNEEIKFPHDRGLHLIYGPNEAGKSTMLRAIVDALFGIPHNSLDGFLHEYGNLRIEAGLSLSDGNSIAFRRRKGLKNTVLDLEDQAVDERLLEPYTAGLDRAEFENMFGLDHLRLRAGGKQLLESGGSLGESLFEAASGLQDLRYIMQSLEKKSGELFKPSGKVPVVNKLASQYREDKRELDSALLSVRSFKVLEKKYREELVQLEALEERLKQLEARKARLSRIKRTKPLLTECQSFSQELDILGDLPRLAPDSSERYANLINTLNKAKEGKKSAGWELETLQREVEALEIPQGILEQEEVIDQLHGGLALYRKAVQDLPALENNLELLKQSTLSKLRELRPQAQDLSVAEEYRLPLHVLDGVDELAERFLQLQGQLDRAKEALESKIVDVENTRKTLAQFGSVADTTELQQLVNKIRGEGNLEKLRQAKELEAAQLQAVLADELNRLILWQGSLEDLVLARLPLTSTIAQFEEEHQELLDEVCVLKDKIQNLESSKLSLEQELVQISIQGKVPSETELMEARTKRDQGWKLILKAWIDGQPDHEGEAQFAGNRPLHEAYSESVLGADLLSDELRRESERVARQVTAEGKLAAIIHELEQRHAELMLLQNREADFNERWSKVWSEFPFEPLSPQEMQEWLLACESIVTKYAELVRKRKQGEDIDKLSKAYAQELREALTNLGIAPYTQLSDLVEQASLFCQNISELKGRYEGVLQRLEEQKTELGRAERRVQAVQQELTDWREEWLQLMGQVKLPIDTTPQVAQKSIKSLRKFLELLDNLAIVEKNKEQQETLIARYQAEVVDVATKAGLTTNQQDTIQLVGNLVQLSRKATSELATKQEKTKRIEVLETEILGYKREIKQSRTEIETLMAEAKCATTEELEQILYEHGQVQALQAKIEEKEGQLLQLGDGLSLEELESEAMQVDIDTIDYELQKVENELLTLRQEQTELNQSFGVTKNEYNEKIQGKNAIASLAAEQAQATLASLSGVVEEYLKLKLGSLVLKRGIERYRDEHQDPVLKRAGKIFSLLTGGSFSQLVVDYDASENPVIKGLRQGAKVVGVEGMSDGTQDQLYLALRLASIEHYLEQGEPMPLIVDDVLINFDDRRSAAALQALAELAQYTQVIMFTHHVSIVSMVKKMLPESNYAIHVLGDVNEEEPLYLDSLALA
ncbi:MAG: AAA family ATPase [Firmicutes bacterium]|nr:AAA family ATPase [Bacillota bacterium]